MNYDQFTHSGFAPTNGFASRQRAGNPKQLSVALPPRANALNDDVQTPRTTSRSHLLAGLRTAPKQANAPASAPHNQSRHSMQTSAGNPWASTAYDNYGRPVPQTATGAGFNMNPYAMQAGQQTYALPEQVLAPPSILEDVDDMDPNVLEQLQMHGMFLAQRQQQLQQQLANITAAANQFQNVDVAAYQQRVSAANMGYQAQAPIAVPGQPGLYLVQNAATGQYQYVQADAQQTQYLQQQRHVQPEQGRPVHGQNGGWSGDASRPVFRAEISPPPLEQKRSVSPQPQSRHAQPSLDHVEPLPPPSANAFRRGHAKKPSLALSNTNNVIDGPRTASAATFGSSRVAVATAPLTGTFGPGAARAGEHPLRQPRGPPPLDELMALPTANHEGSKNFAARRRLQALNLVRASSVRRSASNPLSTASPTSEGGMSLAASEEDEPGLYRKQSPIGSERSTKRGSQSSVDGSINSSAVQTPATEDNVFDLSNFAKQLPSTASQAPERRKMMLGVLSAAEKRKSTIF